MMDTKEEVEEFRSTRCLDKCGYHGNALSDTLKIMSSTSTSQGNPVYKILCGLHKDSGNSLIHKVFGNTIVTMAMPCLTHEPKLSHLYAQLHINIIHPCKYEENSLNNKGGVIRTRIFKVSMQV